MKRPYFHVGVCLFLTGLLVAGLPGSAGAPRAAAADLAQLDASVKLIPADAAVYATMLRNRELVEMVLESNAWARIMNMPATQWVLMMYNLYAANPESELGRIHAMLEDPEVKELLDLACDMGSHEIFFYGDENVGKFLELAQKLNNARSYGPLVMMLTGQGADLRPDQMQAKALLDAVLENLDEVVVPDMLVGFKLTDTEAAKAALVRLEALMVMAQEAEPRLQGRFKKETIGGHEFLVLRLDGEVIPWDEVPLHELEELGFDEDEIEKLVAHAKTMKLVVAAGLRENYLLLSVGSSLGCIEKLSSGPRLIDQPEMKPLEKFTDEKLLTICYVGESMNRKLNERNLNNMLDLLQRLLPLANLSEKQNKRIQNDAEALVDDLKSWMPKVRAVSAVSFLAPQGIEGYSYTWGEFSPKLGAQPLSLLEHVGGDPLLGIVGRQENSLEQYEAMVKWAKTGWKYFEDFGLPNLSDDERETVEAFMKDAIPLLKRLDRANREMLFPALEDGQTALVLDAKFTSKQFHEEMPEADEALPLPEPAVVWGISDAEKLKQGVSEYYAVIEDLLDIVRKHEPDSIPEEVTLPKPTVTQKAGATNYAFPLPAEWGFDPNLVPNAGLTDRVAAVSLTVKTTERILKPTPLKVGGVLENPSKPRTGAVWLHWAGVVDAARPWLDFILDEMLPVGVGVDRDSVADQVHTVTDVLKVLKKVTVESRLEDDCLVTHSLMEIQDVPK